MQRLDKLTYYCTLYTSHPTTAMYSLSVEEEEVDDDDAAENMEEDEEERQWRSDNGEEEEVDDDDAPENVRRKGGRFKEISTA